MIFSFDTETHLIEPGVFAPQLVCVTARQYGPGVQGTTVLNGGLEHDKDAGVSMIEHALDHGWILLGHNFPFDAAVAIAYRPHLLEKFFKAYEEGRIRDTQTRQRLIDVAHGRKRIHGKSFAMRGGQWVVADYSLGGNPEIKGSTGLAGYWLGKDRSAQKGGDGWRLRYKELDGINKADWPIEAIEYAKEDTDDALEVHLAQARACRLGDEEPLVNEVEQERAAFVLHLMSRYGIRTDGKRVADLEAACIAKRDETRGRLLELGYYRYEGPKKDPRRKVVKNTKLIRSRVEEVFANRGDEAPKTEKGATKMDADTLELSLDPILIDLAEAGPMDTVLKTFIPALKLGVDVPIHTRFDPLLETGRISSSKPNLNNIPRGLGVRECFTPRSDFLYCSVDYDCAELRSWAQINVWMFGLANTAMAQFFRNDPHGDPHLELAALILGITSEEARARKKAGDPQIKGVRQMCKAINFGLPGGMGVDKLIESARKGYDVIFTESEAHERRQQWRKKWPEARLYLSRISELVGDGTADIIQFRSNRKRGGCGYSDAANSYFQGLTADGAKHALWLVTKECYLEPESPLYGSRPVGFLYDEILAEVPIERAHEAATRLAEVMVAGMQAWLPDVPVTAAPALMTRWTKGAEAAYSPEGRLVAWEPKTAMLHLTPPNLATPRLPAPLDIR